MMKATIKFRLNNTNRQKTINVDSMEVNSIIREFLTVDDRVDKNTYITTVKCGRKEYQWFDFAKSAFS